MFRQAWSRWWPRRASGRGPTVRDTLAGLATGLFSVPEGMAFARIAGFDPVAGLYAGLVPTIVGASLSRTAVMVVTLTSALALTSHAVLADAGLDPMDAGNVAALALLVGVLMLTIAALRLGSLLRVLSTAVMTGFSCGVAVQIITGALGDTTGYAPPEGNKLAQVGDWVWHIGRWRPDTSLVAAATLAVWALAHAVRRTRTAAPLAALVMVSVGVGVSGAHVPLVRDIAELRSGLPDLSPPAWGALPHLAGGALSVTLVALAQSASIGPMITPGRSSRGDLNRDIVAQGAANLAGAMLGSLPVGGSLSRTGVAVAAGARTRWAAVTAGLWLAAITLLLAPLAARIPLPAIGMLLILVAGKMIRSKWHDIVLTLRASPTFAVALLATFLATTQWPLQLALALGVVLSLLPHGIQAVRQAGLFALVPGPEGTWSITEPPIRTAGGEITVLGYRGTSLFIETHRIDAQWPAPDTNAWPVLVLILHTVPDIPSPEFLSLLRRRARELDRLDGRLILAGVGPRLARTLHSTRIAEELDVIPAHETPLQPLRQALSQGDSWLARRRGSDAPGTNYEQFSRIMKP